ncbi:MAG: hypothetical protein LBJ25_07940 [Candidatus Margulisbacteria bacterium]|jgi:hypothetical protein|nr:hypothetical protein [Candidatus Margulisiibacteriota bacterium]
MQTKIISDALSKLKTSLEYRKDIEPALWKNEKFVFTAFKQIGIHMLRYAHDSLRKDKKFMRLIDEMIKQQDRP